MKLLDDIVDAASSDTVSVSEMLRKGLILAHRLKNETLKTWITQELNGYEQIKDLPKYRSFEAIARGHFHGPFGSSISNQSIPAFILKKEHRDFAERVYLLQPIAAYLSGAKKDGKIGGGSIEWPPDLIALYARSFYEGNFVLVSAWQDIPSSVILGLSDTVRTRILQIVLELQDELGASGKNDVSELPKTKVDPIVSYNIYGGNNVITGHARDVSQTNNITVAEDDFDGLARALSDAGVPAAGVSDLEQSIREDKQNGRPPMGEKVQSWVVGLGRFLGPPAVDVATKALEGYFGLS